MIILAGFLVCIRVVHKFTDIIVKKFAAFF
jgi:hypothetical protein